MENGTAGSRQTAPNDIAALWKARAERQALRADRLTEALERIGEIASEIGTHAFDVANDDRLFCEDLDCGRRGWPEDGFRTVDSEVGPVSFCRDHWEATP